MSKTLRLVLGDQLNAQHAWFKQKSDQYVYLIAELVQEANYTNHHIQKICAFFAAMAEFAQALEKAGHQVIYLTLDDTANFKDLPSLLKHLISVHKVTEFQYQLPDEFRLRQQLSTFCEEVKIVTQANESEHFYIKDSELTRYFKAGKKHRLEHFYRKLRVEFDVLMENGEPLGGKWNYDGANRNKLKASDLVKIPEPLMFANDVSRILERLERHKIKTIGTAQTKLLWPINRKQATELLAFFCQYLLPQFGQFQDAMTGKLRVLDEDRGWSLYHSRLSFALNTKMISPQQVVKAAISAFEGNQSSIDIAQIEGFVRQILGWREFIRGVYWANMPDYRGLNFLSAQRAMPDWFWSGKTNMRCVSHAINQSLEFAYAHHIQRLMVTGNFCLIAGIHPDEVDHWYLGVYIDAIEWVELPNTRGMSQFADGGIVGSKAYAASGNYINKMSDYCGDCAYQVKKITGDDACPMNALYWHFMHHHYGLFANNPRTKMVYSNWLKKTEEDRQAVLQRATYLLENLNAM